MKRQSFKKYARSVRTQATEEQFGSGMNYTSTPLAEGLNKLIVNLDMKEKGAALIPRQALVTNEISMLSSEVRKTDTVVIPYSDELMLHQCKDCTEENGKRYRQLVMGKVSDTKLTNTDLYLGELYIGTSYIDGDLYEGGALPTSSEVKVSELHWEAIASDVAVSSVLFQRPSLAGIHGMLIADADYIARPVGTFAFEDSFYCFRQKANAPAELVHTYSKSYGHTNSGPFKYAPEVVVPRELTAKEAVTWGYNMLKDNPYEFTNSFGGAGIQFLGLMPYDASGALLLTPKLNQTLLFKLNYAVLQGKKYDIVWEWKEAANPTYTTFQVDKGVVFDTLKALEAPFSAPVKNIMVRVSAYGYTNNVVDTLSTQVLTVGFGFDETEYGSTANITPKNYDLSTASGMCYWKNKLVLWGIKEDPTVLFMSETNDPSYFPYPNNADLIEDPIVTAMPFLDNLLVFTSNKLYVLTLSSDGLSHTRKLIQGNLNIAPWDVHLIKQVKNMVFFKSGNYFYMVVPKAYSTTGELTIAPIARPYMENFFDNFKTVVEDILKTLYNYSDSLELAHYYNYMDYEDVHNVYVFKTSKNCFLNFVVLYDTVQRAWRIHLYESQEIVVPFKQDATKKGTLMSLVATEQRYTNNLTNPVTYPKQLLPSVQFLNFERDTATDFYVPYGTKFCPAMGGHAAEYDVISTKLAAQKFFKNIQLLDTGNRDHNSDFKKRYREIQMKFNNVSQKIQKVYTDFAIDGGERTSLYTYRVAHNTDKNSPEYGTIYVEQIPQDPTLLPGATTLAPNEGETEGFWTLDTSAFPEVNVTKVRITVSGKGYAPKVRILTTEEELYELLNISWVYRELNSR